MKLQISFDMNDLEKAIAIAKQVESFCDQIEIGTILIHKYGVKAVEDFRKALPEKIILADTKIIDRGKDIAEVFSKTKTDWLTVMAGTSNDVIHRACTEAHKHNMKVMLDLVDSVAPGQSAMEAKGLGADAILFHQAYDERESLLFLEKWDMIHGNTDLPIFISAKINRDNVDKIIATKPHGIIIGKSITDAENPAEEAKFFYGLCKK